MALPCRRSRPSAFRRAAASWSARRGRRVEDVAATIWRSSAASESGDGGPRPVHPARATRRWARCRRARWRRTLQAAGHRAPAVAARARCPATTALATLDPTRLRKGHARPGANVVMPNLYAARTRGKSTPSYEGKAVSARRDGGRACRSASAHARPSATKSLRIAGITAPRRRRIEHCRRKEKRRFCLTRKKGRTRPMYDRKVHEGGRIHRP